MPNAGTCPLCCSSHELSELLGYFHTRHQKKSGKTGDGLREVTLTISSIVVDK